MDLISVRWDIGQLVSGVIGSLVTGVTGPLITGVSGFIGHWLYMSTLVTPGHMVMEVTYGYVGHHIVLSYWSLVTLINLLTLGHRWSNWSYIF